MSLQPTAHSQQLKTSTLGLAVALALVTGGAWADNYASGYSSGGSGQYLSGYGSSGNSTYLSGYSNGSYTRSYGTPSTSFGSRGGFVRDFESTQWGSAVTIQRNTNAAQVRNQRAANQAARNAYHNANPPCGVYGRVPKQCLRGVRN